MRSALKTFGAVAVLSLAGATLATSNSAQAQYYHRGYGGGWVGPAIVGGLMLGALAASRPYYGYPAYGYGPSYAYEPTYDYQPAPLYVAPAYRRSAPSYASDPAYAYTGDPAYAYDNGYGYNTIRPWQERRLRGSDY